jgi:ABC-type antimicrobial peptide transport system permease subunit
VGLGTSINALGLSYQPPIAGEPLPFRIALGWEVALPPFVVTLSAALVSVLYPSWRALRLRPVEALRHV